MKKKEKKEKSKAVLSFQAIAIKTKEKNHEIRIPINKRLIPVVIIAIPSDPRKRPKQLAETKVSTGSMLLK